LNSTNDGHHLLRASKNAVFNPVETFESEKEFATLKRGIMTFLFPATALILVLFLLVSFSAFLPQPFSLIGTVLGGVGLLLLLLYLIPVLLGSLINSFISTGIVFVVARLLGGKGRFVEQYYLSYLPMPFLSLIAAVSLIPILILAALLPSLALLLVGLLAIIFVVYFLYLYLTALRVAHDFSWGKTIVAALVLLLPLVVVIFAIAGILLSFL